jgi:dihydroflavonol-4-reductase
MSKKVLLTGVSGYIGLHCVKALLENGYHVTGSVRNKSKQEEVISTLHSASVSIEHLSFTHLDLNSDKGWDEALSNCDYVMHVASPFTIENPKNESEMFAPAIDGTLRVLKFAKKNGVKRVVLTSSTVAIMGGKKTGEITPEDWTDLNSKNLNTYFKSKTLAEQAAWNFIENQSGDHNLELVSINPGGVFGPPLGTNVSGASMSMIVKILEGKTPMIPNMSFPMVDVRDVAYLHVAALTEPKAANQRFIATEKVGRSFQWVCQFLIDNGYKGPSTKLAPNFLLKILSVFDREAKGMLTMLGMNLSADNSKTMDVFDWKPIPFEKTVLDTAVAVKKIISK